MIGCSAPFCNNSTAKGYILKIFPKNAERRAQWVANMNVENWIPTDRSYLCEVHFSPDMWEQRCDGKPKLKPNAVPTIFGYWLKEKTFRQTEDECLMNSIQNEQCSVESMICDEGQSIADKEQLSFSMNSTEDKQYSVSESFDLNEKQDVINEEHQTATKQERENEKLKKALDAQTKRFLRMQRQSKALKDMARRMKHIINQNKYKKALKMMLNEDQIKALFNKRRTVQNWSNETIERALQLKFACGTSGYEELLRQKIPLPSLRTLRRK